MLIPAAWSRTLWRQAFERVARLGRMDLLFGETIMVKEWQVILAEMAILICGLLGLIAKYWGVWVYLGCSAVGVASLFVIFGVGRIARRRFSETIIGIWLVLCASVAGGVFVYIWLASMD